MLHTFRRAIETKAAGLPSSYPRPHKGCVHRVRVTQQEQCHGRGDAVLSEILTRRPRFLNLDII